MFLQIFYFQILLYIIKSEPIFVFEHFRHGSRAPGFGLIKENPIESLEVNIPTMEHKSKSPKTINIGDTKETIEYNKKIVLDDETNALLNSLEKANIKMLFNQQKKNNMKSILNNNNKATIKFNPKKKIIFILNKLNNLK